MSAQKTNNYNFRVKKKGQAERQISISKLKPLQALHLKPINLVVFKVSSGISFLEGGLALRCFQRLSFPNVATQLVPLA